MKKQVLPFIVVSLCFLQFVKAQDNIVYPADASSKMRNVTLAPYNADNTGVTDATAAIQAALDVGSGLIYLPNGTYKVSNTLKWGGTQKRTTLQGQSRAGTIIKLANNAAGYSDAAAPKTVIWTGKNPAQRFSNGIRNLTVNTGSGNPGATGIQFIANNQGGMYDVLIKSDDNHGVYGLDLGYTDEQGPCLIKKIEVIGFKTGIRILHAVDGVVLYNITLKNQTQYGINNDGQCLSIENLVTTGSVPALVNTGAGIATLINSTLTGTGNASGIAAITNSGGIFVRNVNTTGFLKAIDNQKGGKTNSDQNIVEFVSHEVVQLFTSPKQSLNLPIKPTPEVSWDDQSNWVNVGSFPAETITLPNGKIVTDYTNAFQKAIDSGKSTVYFGNGSGAFYGTVSVRGNVKLILGIQSWMGDVDADSNGNHAKVVIENGTSPVVLFEGFSNMYNSFDVLHKGSRTAVFKVMMLHDVVTESGAGDLFIEDVHASSCEIAAGTDVWGRQWNTEGDRPARVLNKGGNLWVLGIKTEDDQAAVRTMSGGQSEIIGGFIYANKSRDPNKIIFVNDEGSRFSATVGEWVIRNQPFHPVSETRDGVTKVMPLGYAPGRGQGSMLPLYTGYRSQATAVPSAAPTNLTGTAPRYDVVTYSWSDNSNNEDGFIIERKIGSGSFVPFNMAFANQTSIRDTLLSPSTSYSFRIRATNSKGQSAYSNTITITTLQAPPTPAVPTSMTATLANANILVTWNDNSNNETGFKLERRVVGVDTVDFTQIALLGPNVSSYYQVGLLGNNSYEYRVRAYLEISHSAYSNVATATIGAPTNVTVHWKMEELSGTIAGDASRHANNGTLNSGTFGSSSVAGMDGNALSLSGNYLRGTNDGRYIRADNYPLSMCVWVKSSDDGTAIYLGDKDGTDKYYSLGIAVDGNAILESSFGTNVKRVTGPNIKDGQWHFLTGVYESVTNHKLYVDGVLAATLVDNFPYHRYMTRFSVGRKDGSTGSNSLTGYFDDARLYERVLTAAEILALNNLTPPVTVPVTGVSVTPISATINLAAIQQLTASVSPSNASDKSVTWSSSSTTIATVNSSGLVTAVASGTATITVRTVDQGKTATCSITVSSIPVTGVTIAPTSVIMNIGDAQQLTATVTPSNATNKNVSYITSNSSVATVSSTGHVTAVAGGTATITVTTVDGNKIDSAAITVINPEYQAESYTALSGAWKATAHAGYTGSGYMILRYSGHYFEWNNVNAPVSGTYSLTFTYSSPDILNTANIIVNGVTNTNLSFARNANWVPVSCDVFLNAGNNTVRVKKSVSPKDFQIDKMAVGVASAASILKSGSVQIIAENNENIQIWPNPVSGGILNISGINVNTVINVYNMLSKNVLSLQMVMGQQTLDVSNLPKGMYIISIQSKQGKFEKKVIIE